MGKRDSPQMKTIFDTEGSQREISDSLWKHYLLAVSVSEQPERWRKSPVQIRPHRINVITSYDER